MIYFFYTLLIILGTFGTSEIVVIVILALLLFGGKKIPELMKGLGTGLKEFKKASELENSEDNLDSDSDK
ncbi:Sec-independent protein translocase subunit TatA/TatB [Blattabacterium cuenoti]|uniref:Sec-independent protein translocase subunit TatA/TatB n=1 Tax=Blattabacterium cuenoti TaxID=1653831 RepID=UPI00163BFDA8|nr:twin-arginine translocase TatA/TatE family subunit [Blattabacterium cuenoti]